MAKKRKRCRRALVPVVTVVSLIAAAIPKLNVSAAAPEVPYGTAIADAVTEAAWDSALSVTADKLLQEEGVPDEALTADGTAKLNFLYDDVYLYISADVSDNDVYINHEGNEDEDGITITVAKGVDAGKEVYNYVLTAGGSARKKTVNTSGFSATWDYTVVDDAYVSSVLTESGYHLEAAVAWSALGIDPAVDRGFALEAVVNSCSSTSAKRDYRKATNLTAYPNNEESYPFWWLTIKYNAGLYAENLLAYSLAEKGTDTVAEDIGRYRLLHYIDRYEAQNVTPYPVADSFDAAVLEEARSYAFSESADKAGIESRIQALDTMANTILEENCYGKLMTKRGTPLVDGEEEALWEGAYVYKTSVTKDGQYAEIRTLWDEEAVYALVKVYDPTYDVSGMDAHTKDSVEFFVLEAEDAAQNSYGKNGGQWRINRAGDVTVTFGQNEPFYAQLSEMEDGRGYIVEARWEAADAITLAPDFVMNFDVAVNLCENGNRTDVVAWTSTDCYSNPNTSGQIIYLDASAGESIVPGGYNPYALLKVLDKALVMNREDFDTASFDASYDRNLLERYYAEALGGTLSAETIQSYYNTVIAMMAGITYDGVHKSALGFEANHSFPDPFTAADGSLVTTAEEWEARRDEIKDLYEFYMYGKIPDAEETGLLKSFSENGDGSYTITVSRNSVTKSFNFKVYMPEGEAPESGWPYIINYGGNISGAQAAGYAVIDYSSNGDVAANNSYYQGVFYELYPECRGDNDVSGVGPLAARAWGAGLIIDAIEAGTGSLSALDPLKSAVSGFSYLGKTALVTGALEERIAVTNPAHSGMGGAALFRYSSQGKYYSASEYPMENDFLTAKTEPIGQVQGQGAAWVKTIFADFLGSDNVPFDTYMLLSMVAPRGLFISAGYYDNGTDPEGMFGSYLGAQQVYKLLGAEGNIAYADFPTAHQNSEAETQAFLQFLDYYFYGKELPEDFYDTVYDNSPDRAEYDVIRIPQKPVVDPAKLQQAVDKAEEIEEDLYTQESYAAVQEALKQAQAVLNDPSATQSKIDEAAEALEEALAALQKIPAQPEPTEPAEPTESAQPSDPTEQAKPTKPDANGTGPASPATGDRNLLPYVLGVLFSAAILAGGLIWNKCRKEK